MNPLTLTGPEFLAFYLSITIVAVVLAILIRWWLRQPADDLDTPPELSALDIAFLAGGNQLAVHAALTHLIHEKSLALDAKTGTLSAQQPLSANAPALEQTLYGAVAEGAATKLANLYLVAGLARQSYPKLPKKAK